MALFLHGLRIKWGWTIIYTFICRTLDISVVEAVSYVLYEMERYFWKNNLAFHNYPLFRWPISIETQGSIFFFSHPACFKAKSTLLLTFYHLTSLFWNWFHLNWTVSFCQSSVLASLEAHHRQSTIAG